MCNCDKCGKKMPNTNNGLGCPKGWAYAQANGSKVGLGTIPLDELMFCPNCWVKLLVWVGYASKEKPEKKGGGKE